MAGMDIFFLVFSVLGGLALFIFGMNVMTEGLRTAAGSQLRVILAKTTGNRFLGLGLGTVLGFLVHSSATTVMLVGFINAGLMSLLQSIPAMLGANVGTTLSMQMISFKLDDYCYFAITLGFIINMVARGVKAKSMGRALMGFGLLFLGMKTMSGAIKPYRDLLAPVMAHVDGRTASGMVLGVLVSTAITGVIQSSGATIAMCYALVTAGVFTSLPQAYPIVLGAHIGTCATALLGSIGTNIEARRSAISHLLFNIINVIFAMLAAKLFFWFIPKTSGDLIHQIANLHTAVMVVAALAFLPIIRWHEKLVRLVTPSKSLPPEPSFLDNELVATPETAISAAVQELQRIARICARSMRLNADLLFDPSKKILQAIKLNEGVINEIKTAMKDYLTKLSHRQLSERQAIIILHLDRCMTDIERIGDHIEQIADISWARRQKKSEAIFDEQSFSEMFALYEKALQVLCLVIESLDIKQGDFQDIAKRILAMRDEYITLNIETRSRFIGKIARQEMPPLCGMYYAGYLSAFERIVKHSKSIALAEQQPQFLIKRGKLGQVAPQAPDYKPPELVDPNDFLDRLQSERYM
ncbi:MAG: Na/Pi cotransporter family protein [Kiritimatiellae bacterium]|nr:Na/Pi cotransporter family protein [Kiritimatiellia bacterium]